MDIGRGLRDEATMNGLALLTLVASLAHQAPAPELTLERLVADPPLQGEWPTGSTPSPGGRWLAFTQASATDSTVQDLWATPLAGGTPVLLVRAADLAPGTTETLTEAERMQRERKRISVGGIVDFVWCGADDHALLLPYSGDLYHVRLADGGQAPTITRLTHDEAPELDPTCDASGTHVAFVKGQDLWVTDVGGEPRQLTHASAPTITFGLAEFIAAEEMDRFTGYSWAPDGQRLVVFEVDEAPVAEKVRPMIYADRTELFHQRYPAAGAANATVRLHIVETSGKSTLVSLPSEDGYVARAELAKDGALLVQWQKRDQRQLRLLEARAPSWQPRLVLQEEDDTWVDLTNDLRVLDAKRLLWSSERSGTRQLYVVDRKSGKAKMLAKPGEPVRAVVGLDREAGVAFVEAGVDRGREQQVFALPLDGKKARRITSEPGTHRATFDEQGKTFIDTWSRFGEPWKVALRHADGTLVQMLADNPASELASYPKATPIVIPVKADDGTELNAMVMPPVDREAGKTYPVVTYVYGGPTGQIVADQWNRLYPFLLWLTEHGYGVFMVDNRGSGGRDHKFAHAIFHRFGDIEVVDVFKGVEALKAHEPWVDADRIGIFGWSYGGYLAARAVLDEHTPFAAAVAVAPVTDWKLYDTHYTERYLGLPSASDAYTKSSLVTRAALLKKPLAIIHGMADDNVLFENTLQLVEALQSLSIPFDFMAYPGRAHGLSGRATTLHLYRTISGFFEGRMPWAGR